VRAVVSGGKGAATALSGRLASMMVTAPKGRLGFRV
jgi:hypothetical protein